MAATGSLNKRANFVASKAHWSKMRGHSGADSRTGDPRQDSICQWLISGYQHDSQPNFCVEPAVSLRKHNSAEDDLDLGVEASLYGKETTHRTTDESHRPLSTSPTLPCRNSGTCASSALSECLSVMDVLNLWHDDPEELLLDLGFGSDEPDIAVKIPARFINHPSQARGINIQVFLEAQKNRIDVENPDLSNRFRQLEVLHQVATAFSSLVSSPPGTQPLATQPASGQPAASRLGTSQPSPEASEKRKRLAMLLRRASRKTLGQSTVDQELQRDPQTGRDPEARSDSHPELQPSLKRSQQFLLHSEGSALSALAEEQGPSPDISRPLLGPTWSIKEAPFRGRLGRDAPSTVPSVQSCKKSPTNGRDRESFELEEIQSFDDSVVTGSVMGPSNGTDSGVVRMNSCQSDSSGFLEEPVIPSQFQQGGPGHELMKTMIAMSEDSSKSQGAQKGCLDTLSPALLFPRPVDKVRTYREGDGSISRSLEVSADPGVYWADCGAKAESNKEGEKEVEDSATQLVDYSAASPTNEEPVGGATDGGGVGVFIEDSHSEEDTEQCTVESRVSLLRDDADRKRSRYLSSEEDTPKLDEEAELPELTAIQSFTEDTRSEESCSGRDQGVSDAPLARSQPSPQAADSDPIAMYLGPDIIGFEGGKPTSGALRSVSVQMPSSLASVSQTLNGRATPATQTSSSEQGRVWYDDDHPLPPDLSLAFPPQHGGQSSEGEFHTRSTSLDTGLAYEEDDEEEETEAGRWKVTAGACCCRCHHSCSCCPPQALHCHCNRRRPCGANHEMQQFTSMSSTFPYSMDELDEMMQCARVFRLVLADIERRLGEEQASLYGELTEEDREDIRVIRDLRLAMRKEAMDLELQLAELAHHYDQGFKTKMHQLLDEQSYLCAQLRIHPPEFQACSPTPIHGVSHAPRLSIAHGLRTRTVATQCSLLPWPPLRDVCDQEGLQIPQYAVDASQPGSEQPLREKQTKPDFVAFLQSLKEPLRSSVTRETLK